MAIYQVETFWNKTVVREEGPSSIPLEFTDEASFLAFAKKDLAPVDHGTTSTTQQQELTT